MKMSTEEFASRMIKTFEANKKPPEQVDVTQIIEDKINEKMSEIEPKPEHVQEVVTNSLDDSELEESSDDNDDCIEELND